MRVLVTFIVDTEDYGKEEFKKEIEKLIADIDEDSKLVEFEMMRVKRGYTLEDYAPEEEMKEETNRNSKSEIQKDIDFLKELIQKINDGYERHDSTFIEYATRMVQDWIDELEELQAK